MSRMERPAIAPWASPIHGIRGQRLLDLAARPVSLDDPFAHMGTVGEWTCSSDGRVALAVQTAPALLDGLGPLGELLAAPASFKLTHLVSTDLLREPVLAQQRVNGWAEVPVGELRRIALAPRTCPDCSGSGACGHEDCGCLALGACALCAGHGVLARNEYRLKADEEVWLRLSYVPGGEVRIPIPPARMLVNRELLWWCIPPDSRDDEVVHVAIRTPPDDGMLVLVGPDWRAMVGGIRPGRDVDERARLVVLVETPRQAPAAPEEVQP